MRILMSETTWHSATIATDLARAGFLLTRADTGAETLVYATDGAQSAILIDHDLPDMSAHHLLRRLRYLHPRMPLFVLIPAKMDWPDRKILFDHGADDLIPTALPAVELVARLRAAIRRAGGFAAPVLGLGALQIDTSDQSVTIHGRPLSLTRKEYEILEMLALARNRMISRDALMNQLYALSDEPGARILNVYLSRIRSAISAAGGDPAMVETIRGAGYLLRTAQAA